MVDDAAAIGLKGRDAPRGTSEETSRVHRSSEFLQVEKDSVSVVFCQLS